MYPAVVCTIPLGLPVLPEVYSMNSGCSDSTHSQSQSALTLSISSCHHVSRPSTIGHSPARRLYTTTDSTVKSSLPNSSAASIWVLSCTGLAPRITASHVTTILLCASAIRPRIASGLNPPKTTE